MRRIFYKRGAKRRILIPLDPFFGKRGAAAAAGYSSPWSVTDVSGRRNLLRAGRQEWRPLQGALSQRFRQTAPAPVSEPPPRRRGAGGKRRLRFLSGIIDAPTLAVASRGHPSQREGLSRGGGGGRVGNQRMRRSRKPFSRRPSSHFFRRHVRRKKYLLSRKCAACGARSVTAGKPLVKGPQTFHERLSARSPLAFEGRKAAFKCQLNVRPPLSPRGWCRRSTGCPRRTSAHSPC